MGLDIGVVVLPRSSLLKMSFLLGGDFVEDVGVTGGDMNSPVDAGDKVRNNDELDDDEGRLLSFSLPGIVSLVNFPSGVVGGEFAPSS